MSTKKAKAQAKANNILYKDILANLNKSTEGLLKTSFGVKKSDIYKEEIFQELSDKEKKIARKKFRNTILSLSESLTQEKDKTRLEKLKKGTPDLSRYLLRAEAGFGSRRSEFRLCRISHSVMIYFTTLLNKT